MQSQLNKPLLVYDSDCEFCRYWVNRMQHLTADRVDYAPYQEVASNFPDISISEFQNSVKLVLVNGKVLSGAEAVFYVLNNRLVLWCYYNFPGYAPLSEFIYRFVAKHRSFFTTVTRWLR